MNLAYFQMLLQEAIDNATSTIDFLSLSQALEKLTLGQIRTVSTFANLPTAATNEGLLVWVTADERLYWSIGSAWYSIVTDNRVYAWSWGNGGFGVLGDNTTTSKISPVSVVGGISDWCDISGGSGHTLAIRYNGTAWSWGLNCNTAGQLGDGSVTCRSSPVSVFRGFTDWRQISAARLSSVAVRSSGSAWAWGSNESGQAGNNSTQANTIPCIVVGGFTDWCNVVSGGFHTTALRTNGTAWAWGNNNYGQLGTNNSITRSSPVSVVGGFTDWCQISAGSCHTVAIRTGGSAWSWGYNNIGQLGDNTTTRRSSPVSVVGGFSDWCQISAGKLPGMFNLAVRTGGSAWSWGCNTVGQLGDNTTTPRSSPVSVVGGFTNWCQVSAGYRHSLGVRTNSSAWSWGVNTEGQLGDNTTTATRSSPVSVVGGSSWCKVAGGVSHSLALSYDDFV